MTTYQVDEHNGEITLTEIPNDSPARLKVIIKEEVLGEVVLVKDDSEMTPFQAEGTEEEVMAKIKEYIAHKLFKVQDRPHQGEVHGTTDSERKIED